jgi:hypothetical protein
MRVGARFSTSDQTDPETYSVSCAKGTGVIPGVKRFGRGVEHPPSTRAEVENGNSYTSFSLLCQQ